MERIGVAIRKGRMSKGWNQKQLAEAIRVDPSLISRWESNLKIPPGDALLEMAELLDIVPLLFPDYRKENTSASKDAACELFTAEIPRL